jgi:hypothetical protein
MIARTTTTAAVCFRNAARHLIPGGRFVIELWVPEPRKLPPGQQAAVWRREPGHILMAQLAGFDLESRHADWSGSEFTAESRSHVSVYRLAGR